MLSTLATSTLDDYLDCFDTWTEKIIDFVHHSMDIQQNVIVKNDKNHQRALNQETTLITCLYLYEAFHQAKIYTLGELTTEVFGYKTGTDPKIMSEHKAAQGRLTTVLEALQAYELITREKEERFISASVTMIQYRIVATDRLMHFFDHSRSVERYQQAA